VNLSNISDRKILKIEDVPGGHDPSQYETQRLWVNSSRDAHIQIPVTLFYSKNEKFSNPRPFIIYGYGSYEISSDVIFDQKKLSFLDRGIGYAVAHVRGGGEMGREWYENGRVLHKKNTFYDFVDTAKSLITHGWTDSSMLAAIGRSAGGLLIGAVHNMAPSLFRAMVADVPFVDCVNAMLDPTIPLTVLEYTEWGNPSYLSQFNSLLEFSPYENLDLSGTSSYPTLLLTAGLYDRRVSYSEPAKYTAKYRYLHATQRMSQNSHNQPFQLLLKTDMSSGHFSKTGRYDLLREWAFEYAFLISQLLNQTQENIYQK
jgi:oligopeptidase B